LLLAEFLSNQSLIYGGPLLVPCLNSRCIGRGGSIALWIVDFDHPVRFALDVALADFPAQADQILFLTSLVHHEEDVDLVERIDRLHRDVVGIAGTDADDKDLSHLQASSAIHTGQQFLESYSNEAWVCPQHRCESEPRSGPPARPIIRSRPRNSVMAFCNRPAESRARPIVVMLRCY